MGASLATTTAAASPVRLTFATPHGARTLLASSGRARDIRAALATAGADWIMTGADTETAPPAPMTGQQAYEAECAECPTYGDGSPRPAWADLSELARMSWDANPTPRRIRPVWGA